MTPKKSEKFSNTQLSDALFITMLKLMDFIKLLDRPLIRNVYMNNNYHCELGYCGVIRRFSRRTGLAACNELQNAKTSE